MTLAAEDIVNKKQFDAGALRELHIYTDGCAIDNPMLDAVGVPNNRTWVGAGAVLVGKFEHGEPQMLRFSGIPQYAVHELAEKSAILFGLEVMHEQLAERSQTEAPKVFLHTDQQPVAEHRENPTKQRRPHKSDRWPFPSDPFYRKPAPVLTRLEIEKLIHNKIQALSDQHQVRLVYTPSSRMRKIDDIEQIFTLPLAEQERRFMGMAHCLAAEAATKSQLQSQRDSITINKTYYTGVGALGKIQELCCTITGKDNTPLPTTPRRFGLG